MTYLQTDIRNSEELLNNEVFDAKVYKDAVKNIKNALENFTISVFFSLTLISNLVSILQAVFFLICILDDSVKPF